MSETDSGFFLIDKEPEWTSFQVVNKIKYLFKYQKGLKLKVGHAGTLDPLATGLLIVCYGKMTKEISKFQNLKKEYTGIIQLGATTPSYDAETEIDQEFPTQHLTEEKIKKAAKELIGKQWQRPPDYSAKRVNGIRAYELARKGEKINIKKHEIEVFDFSVELVEGNKVTFRIECSKGTYIRSLAYEMGVKLNSGGYLSLLRRTNIGEYSVDNAMTIKSLEEQFKSFSK